MAMFQQPVRPAGTVHAEFKAGKCDWNGSLVTSDKRKGKIVLFTSDEDSLMHFQWHDREKSEVVLDLIFCNDAYLTKIDKCKDGRVYLLRFTSSDKKLFYWMQEPKTEGDDELIKKFNEAIDAKIPEKKPAGGAAAPAGAAAAGAGADVDPQLRAVLAQFLEAQGQQQGGARQPPVPLQAVLTTEVLQGLTTDEQAVKELTELMPPGQQTPQDLKEALASPQLQQHLHSLTQAIHSDQLPVLFASLGLDPSTISSAAPGSDALEILIRAMEAKHGGGS